MSGQVDTRAAREGLRSLSTAIWQAGQLAVRAAIEAAETSAKATTLWQDRTGATRAAIHGERSNVFSGFLEAGGASRFLESGTRPHDIHGRPFLRFVVNGQTLFRRVVHHPGTSERPFMTEARRVGEQAMEYGIEYFVGEAIART